jgi:hypothetical protein
VNDFKGHFGLKQYLPGKSTPWWMKTRSIPISISGYLQKHKIYAGRKEKRNRNENRT